MPPSPKAQTILQLYPSPEQLRRAILIAAATAFNIPTSEILTSNSEPADLARKTAFFLARRIVNLPLELSAAIIGSSVQHAKSIERYLRLPKSLPKLLPKIQTASKLLSSPPPINTDNFPTYDSIHSMCSISIHARLAEIQWLLAYSHHTLNSILSTLSTLLKRDSYLTTLDNLIAAGWGNTPYHKIPKHIIQAASSNSPIPPPSKIHNT